MRLSFRANLIFRMAIVLVVTIAVVGIYTYYQALGAARELSERVVRQTTSNIDSRIGALLGQVETQSRLVAGTIRPTVARERELPVDSRSFREVGVQLIELAKINREYGRVSVVLDRTGEYVEAEQGTAGAVSVVTSVLVQSGAKVRREFRPFGDSLFEISQASDLSADRRQTDPYALCKQLQQTVWSDTVMVQDSQGNQVPGVICATPILDSQRGFLGAVTVNLTLSELRRFLLTLEVGQSGFAFLVGYDDDDQATVIVDPQAQSRAGGRPILDQMLASVQQGPPPSQAETRQTRFQIDGAEYIGGFRQVSGERRPNWLMGVVAPQDDYLTTSRQTLTFFFSFGFIALAIGILVSLLLARRVAQPLQRLARETARVSSFDFADTPLPVTNIVEIDTLTDSVRTMKTGLRSMQKLVPAEYAKWLISTGQEAKLGGERRYLTTSFGDIVGFTRLSHQLPPEEIVEVLAEYLEVLSNKVLETGGTLDKFNGDDVMAFWGAPSPTHDHALRAVTTALASVEALNTIDLHLDGRDIPSLSAAFGIATGNVVVGNVGNRVRMNYTVIGDSVNLASRLQSLNKVYETQILVAQETALEIADFVVMRLVDIVEVYGREEPEEIYEPVGLKGKVSEADAAFVDAYNKAFDTYRRKTFTKASKKFEELLRQRPHDGPTRILKERCDKFATDPPRDDWNGATSIGWK